MEVSYRVDLIVCLLSAAAVRLVAHGVREHDSKGQGDLSRCHARTETQALSSREACRMNDRCAYRVGDGTFVLGTSTDIEADARQDFRSERNLVRLHLRQRYKAPVKSAQYVREEAVEGL